MSSLAFLSAFLVWSLLGWAQSEERQPAQAEPDFVRGMRAEHFKAYEHASRRVTAALRDGAAPDPTELKWRAAGEIP
jgi:hypothetical protein